MKKTTAWQILIIAAALFTLSGCATGPTYSDLDRAATPDDAWPRDLPDYASEDLQVDLDSVRYVGRDGTTELYLARPGAADGDVCLLVYPEDDNWSVVCGAIEVSVSVPGVGKYTAHADGAPVDGTAISENVVVS